LSDDPNFSRSQNYFWAIQIYRLFEETLTKTITTWEDFKNDSLDKLNNGRIEHWDEQVQVIDKSIGSLRDKLKRVQESRREITGLRDGLFGAMSLFDSRTAVRQGDNIRLLTYINILFLPLTFCTVSPVLALLHLWNDYSARLPHIFPCGPANGVGSSLHHNERCTWFLLETPSLPIKHHSETTFRRTSSPSISFCIVHRRH
jgi:hypothetical protein